MVKFAAYVPVSMRGDIPMQHFVLRDVVESAGAVWLDPPPPVVETTATEWFTGVTLLRIEVDVPADGNSS